MGLFFRILNFMFVLAWATGTKWPSTIKRCAMNDPNLNKCILRQTEQAIAKMSKGVPAIGLRSLDPLHNVSFAVASKTGPFVVNVHMSNVMITGPSKIQLKRVHFDKQTSTYFIEGYHNLLRMLGNYKIKGSILSIPFDSSGSLEYELRGGFANHSIKLASDVRSAGHGQVRFDLKSVKSMKFTFHDRLLGEQASAALTKLANDNLSLVSNALWDPMEKVIQDVYGKALKPLTSKFTVREFFPATSSGRSEADESIPGNMTITENLRTHTFSYHVQYK